MIKYGECRLIDSLIDLQHVNEQLRPENIQKRSEAIAAELFANSKPFILDGLDELISAVRDEIDEQIGDNIKHLEEA